MDPFQSNTFPQSYFSALLLLSATSLTLSLVFYLKSRSMKKLPKNLKVSVFNKTFNVFNPFPEKRRTFHSYLFFLILSPLTAFAWSFFFVFIIFLEVLKMGLMVGAVLFILGLGLMMISEASEILGNTSSLLKAIRAGTSLGKGDLAVLYIIKKSLGKLSAYYLFLAIFFLSSFFAAPYAFPALLMAFAQFVGAITAIAASTIILAPIVVSLLFAFAMVAAFFVARKVKAILFSFSPISPLTSVFSASARTKISCEMQNDLFDFDPEEITW